MALEPTLTWLQNLDFPTQIRESGWLFPTIETVHVFTLVLLVGSIMTVDLRLLGIVNKERSFRSLSSSILPWTWMCFGIAATAGLLMFFSKAVTYYNNIPFRLKIVCLALAGINMVIFHVIGARNLEGWDTGKTPPGAKFSGAVSLALWTVIVASGRWVGFTT